MTPAIVSALALAFGASWAPAELSGTLNGDGPSYRLVKSPIAVVHQEDSTRNRVFFVYVRLNRDVPRLSNGSPLGGADLGAVGYRPAPPAEADGKGWGFARLGDRGRHCYVHVLTGPHPESLLEAAVGSALPLRILIYRHRTLRSTVRLKRVEGESQAARRAGNESLYARRLGCSKGK